VPEVTGQSGKGLTSGLTTWAGQSGARFDVRRFVNDFGTGQQNGPGVSASGRMELDENGRSIS